MQNDKLALAAGEREPPSLLAELGLSSLELDAVRRQGFVSRELRGRRTVVFKLRFRLDGRQQVRYLGTDPARAERIGRELQVLQHSRNVDRRLRALVRQADQVLQSCKPRLEQQLHAAGFRFHGRAVRRPRIASRTD